MVGNRSVGILIKYTIQEVQRNVTDFVVFAKCISKLCLSVYIYLRLSGLWSYCIDITLLLFNVMYIQLLRSTQFIRISMERYT